MLSEHFLGEYSNLEEETYQPNTNDCSELDKIFLFGFVSIIIVVGITLCIAMDNS